MSTPPLDDAGSAPLAEEQSVSGMELVEGGALDELEARVDRWRSEVRIPPWSRRRAQWNLLSVTEDVLRLRVASVHSEVMELGQYLQLIDDCKYHLKYALAHVRNLSGDALRERPDLNDHAEYREASRMLDAHDQFNDAMAAFSGARAGTVRCYRDPSGGYAFTNALTFERQANDILESRSVTSEVSPLDLLFRFLYRNDDDLPPALARCVRRVRASTGEIRPRIDAEVIEELDSFLGTHPPVIPPQWRCSFGTGAALSRSFRNLWLTAVAHVVAITNGASGASGVHPNGLLVRWLLGEATPNWLSKAVSMYGGVSSTAAHELLELLTFGAQTDNPDPALQFIFPLRQGLFAIPWFMVATCNLERNFLALMARVRRQEFDAASSAFEQEMLSDLRAAIARRTWRARLSSYVPGERGAGEVDAILVDPDNAFVLVMEMRWFLEPSEVSEVRERERNGATKGGQAQRKRDAVQRALPAMLAELGLDEAGRSWTVQAVAIFDNYLPTPQANGIPFTSHRAFLAGVYREPNLAQLWDWLQRGVWLPQRDVHFVVEPVETTLDTLTFRLDGLNPTAEGEQFVTERDAAVLASWDIQTPT